MQINTIEKKKPGRPKKITWTAGVMSMDGIVTTPQDDTDLVELVYCNPLLFKRVLISYKSYDVSEMWWIFKPEGLYISSVDHLNTSDVGTFIDGRTMNMYYCSKKVRICMLRTAIEKIVATCGKSNFKLTAIVKNDYHNIIKIILKDLEYNNDNIFEIDTISKEIDYIDDQPQKSDNDYPIKMKIAAKHFKSTINNASKLSNWLTIQKYGNEPLQLTFDKPTQKINWTGVYNDPSKIDLQSNITDDEIFSISVSMTYIQPFCHNGIGDDVYIAADHRKHLSLSTMLDKKTIPGVLGDVYAATIKVFTEIKDYQTV